MKQKKNAKNPTIKYKNASEKYLVESTARILNITDLKKDDEFADGRIGLESWVKEKIESKSGVEMLSKMLKKAVEIGDKNKKVSKTLTTMHIKNTCRVVSSTDVDMIDSTDDSDNKEEDEDPSELTVTKYAGSFFDTDRGKEILSRAAKSTNHNTVMKYHEVEIYGLDELNKELNSIPGYESSQIRISQGCDETNNDAAAEDFAEKRYWCRKNCWIHPMIMPTVIVELN